MSSSSVNLRLARVTNASQWRASNTAKCSQVCTRRRVLGGNVSGSPVVNVEVQEGRGCCKCQFLRGHLFCETAVCLWFQNEGCTTVAVTARTSHSISRCLGHRGSVSEIDVQGTLRAWLRGESTLISGSGRGADYEPGSTRYRSDILIFVKKKFPKRSQKESSPKLLAAYGLRGCHALRVLIFVDPVDQTLWG